MTKEELWELYVSKNPRFAGTENITLTPNGLKKLFDQTYDEGVNYALETTTQFKNKTSMNAPDIFEDIFGGFGKKGK
jgi:hypothetical protein